MKSFTNKNAVWLSFVFVLFFASNVFVANAQVKPFLQDINKATPTPTPGIDRTGDSRPINPRPDSVTSTNNAPAVNSAIRTSIPNLAVVDIPGYSGILIESEKGAIVMESFSNYTFNPASNVKVATGYAVLKTFGVDYRFSTNVWTDGGIDQETGTLTGNLYISGRDPIFAHEHAVAIADELNRMGVRKIEGNLVVTDNFSMNYSASPRSSASVLQSTMNGAARSKTATKAWETYLSNTRKTSTNIIPSVIVTGGSSVEGLPPTARILFAHESAPLKEIVKATLSYSNNFLSERLGEMLGGANAVARTVQQDAGVAPSEFSLQTCSGLGINRVSPKAQMKLLRTFKSYLQKNKMTFADVMPVAGMDEGTLQNRYNTGLNRGSLVGKTGTLGNTDSGVSTLSGEITTKNGKFLFVIFNQRGNVSRFRSFQNYLIPLVQNELGGAKPMGYVSQTMQQRLSKSRIKNPNFPDSKRSEDDEEDED